MRQPYDPVANPDAVVTVGNARFTVLTPRLIRMEWSPTACFEDRASFAFVNRRLPVPRFDAQHSAGRLTIRTETVTLRYSGAGEKPSPDNLSIEFTYRGETIRWVPNAENSGNLGGTCRTLDGVSGRVALEPGLLSRDGWTLVDDSQRLLLDDSDWPWATRRSERDALDWYFFAYGHDYARALRDFTAVAGRIPLPPRYVFGAWWSRFWNYTEQELRRLVAEFRRHEVPLDVLVLDMGWHLEGWTGYTWNPKCFADPQAFLRWAHQQGLKIPLNLHPHHGVAKHEAAFAEMARALGLDPANIDRIPFDCADRRFMQAYFEYLHHPLERQGVDFWWMDWQQDGGSSMPGLDPLFWLNYLHWTDWEHEPGPKHERPLIFSRWGSLGNHRYPIGFSGDTFSHWSMLAFQPHFTATAGNVGYAYWSHDIGGHLPGPIEPELYVRWVQWGAFSPILRPHVAMHADGERRPWAFEKEVSGAARAAWLLRYELLPYIYTTARQAYDEALPPCRPLYYHWPEENEAYRHPGQYMFGDDLLVAPVTTPRNPCNRLAAMKVWLPPGQWVHWFTGRTYDGPRVVRLSVPLKQIPLFVRGGAVIPAAPNMKHSREKPIDPLILHAFPARTERLHESRFYEDDGESLGYQRGECRWTPIVCHASANRCEIEIGPAEGACRQALTERAYELHIHNVPPALHVSIDSAAVPHGKPGRTIAWWYDAETFTVVVPVPRRPVAERTRIEVALCEEPEVQVVFQGGVPEYARVLKHAADCLGDQTPAALREALDVIANLTNAPPRIGATVRGLAGDAMRVAHAIQASQLPEPLRTEAIMRLLGVYAEARIEPDPSGAQRATARLEVAADPLLRPVAGLTTGVAFRPPTNWKPLAPARTATTRADGVEVNALTTPFARDGLLQTSVASAQIRLSDGTLEIALPFERVLFPSLNAWWIAGPFEMRDVPQLDARFAKLRRVDRHETFTDRNGRTVGWQRVERQLAPEDDQTTDFFINFADVFSDKVSDAVAYAVAYLWAPQRIKAALRLEGVGAVTAWLNGKPVRGRPVGPRRVLKGDTLRVQLAPGTNVLAVRSNQGGGGWGFAGHLETHDGRPVSDVAVHLET